jgi:hypothetical protein
MEAVGAGSTDAKAEIDLRKRADGYGHCDIVLRKPP